MHTWPLLFPLRGCPTMVSFFKRAEVDRVRKREWGGLHPLFPLSNSPSPPPPCVGMDNEHESLLAILREFSPQVDFFSWRLRTACWFPHILHSVLGYTKGAFIDSLKRASHRRRFFPRTSALFPARLEPTCLSKPVLHRYIQEYRLFEISSGERLNSKA